MARATVLSNIIATRLRQRLRLFVPPDAPVKIIQLRLENATDRPRRVTATFYAEWVLGVTRDVAAQFVIPEFDDASQALLARNPWHPEFGDRVAFAAASKRLHGLTADRSEFLGRMGSLAQPAALGRIGLSSTVQAGLDPCAALQMHIDLPPGGSEEVWFMLGQGADRAEAMALATRFRDPEQVQQAWLAVNDFWDNLLGTVQVHTPDPAMDLLLNRWLLYQRPGMPCLGPFGLLSIERGVWLSRPVAGRDGAGPCGAGTHAPAYPGRRPTAVRGG